MPTKQSPLRNAMGQIVNKGDSVKVAIVGGATHTLLGWCIKRQTVLTEWQHAGFKRKLIQPASNYSLTFAAPAKPTKAEKANPSSHAANLPALLQCWHNNEWHEQGNMATGPFFSQLLAMARDADKWVAYKKRWPILAAQLDK